MKPLPGTTSSAATDAAPPDGRDEQPRYSFESILLPSAAAGANARLRARPRLTEARWQGNVDVAARIADKLTDNAVRHGGPLSNGRVRVRLAVLTSEDLVIEVTDATPDFADFARVTSDELPSGSGLWWVRHYRARLSWEPTTDGSGTVIGKTVRAVVPVSWKADA